MDIDKIADLIKTKRKEKNLTQEELANKICVTEKAVSRWETGRGTPDISLLVPLSNVLGVSVSELLKGHVDKKEDNNIKEIVKYIDETNKNKNKFIVYLTSVIYIILIFLYLFYLKLEFSSYEISYMKEIIINAFFVICIACTNRMLSNNYFDTIEERKIVNKLSYILALVIYLIMYFNLTIFSRDNYVSTYNVIPFKTIIEYFNNCDFYVFCVNIFGNIVILMPLMYLILKTYNVKNYKISLIIEIMLSLSIELIQLISHHGVFDVDDIILNVLGMSIVYFIYKKVNGDEND